MKKDRHLVGGCACKACLHRRGYTPHPRAYLVWYALPFVLTLGVVVYFTAIAL
jgi:hypothetical protein